MSEEKARRLMVILRDAGCKPNEPIEIAQVQAWAEKNGFADLLPDALSSASELGWVGDDGDPTNGRMTITAKGHENGNA